MEIFVARQPIFDKSQEVFGYELLYRKSGKNNYFEEINEDEATSNTIINSFLVIGLDKLTRNSKAFINFSGNLIKQEVMTVLPKEHIIIEILENVIVDDSLIESCKKLKEKGYTIALDDFIFKDMNSPLVDLADIIKVDFMATTHEEQQQIVKQCSSKNIKFLAEKVETYEDFDRAFEYGYSYFQGYFFSKPVIISGKDISPSKLIYLELIRKISDTEPDFAKISKVIEKDVSLTYELLKLVNSAAFSQGNIKSITHAISIIGINEIKKWVYLIALKNLKDNKPNEIINLALIRAKFCETLAEQINMKARSSELFIMGMFSAMDILTDRPIKELIQDIKLSDDIKETLLGEETLIRSLFETVLALEKSDWTKLWVYSQDLKIDSKIILKTYYKSIEWAANLL